MPPENSRYLNVVIIVSIENKLTLCYVYYLLLKEAFKNMFEKGHQSIIHKILFNLIKSK